jgi:hypothetical protein
MTKHIRLMIVSAAVVAAFGPLAAHAASLPNPDSATATAIATWRTNTVALVAPAYRDGVAATYMGKALNVDAQTMNSLMVAKSKAETAAWATLDPASAALIVNYYEALQTAPSH